MTTQRILLVGLRSRLVPAGQTILEQETVATRSTKTAEEALILVAVWRPDLIILGADPEDSSARNLCAEVRSGRDFRQPSILLLSSPLEKNRIEIIREAGANAVLPRPVSPAAFDEAVGRLLTVQTRQTWRVLLRARTKQGVTAFGESRNLSSTGLLLDTEADLEIGELLDLHFFLAGEKTEIQIQGEVVRREAAEGNRLLLGIQFLDPPPEAVEAICHFVRRREKDPDNSPTK